MIINPAVIAAAQTSQRRWNIPASITIAQYALESGWGQHEPPGSNNPFGIKALAGEPFITAMTTEVIGGRSIRVPQAFRQFASVAEAFNDHARLLATSAYYEHARAQLPDVDGFANGLTGTYATDPFYGTKLIALMKANNLYQYDVAKTPEPVQPVLATSVVPPVTAAGATPIAPAASQPGGSVTDFSPDPPVQLPSEANAILLQLGTHLGALVAGALVSAGALQSNQEAQLASIAGGIAVWAASYLINFIVHKLRRKQTVAVVQAAKAS